VRVGVGGRAQHQPLASVLDEVDEARVHGARIRKKPDDGRENLLELERGPDRRDDLVQGPVLARWCSGPRYARNRNPFAGIFWTAR
jgi:hypothetical protein